MENMRNVYLSTAKTSLPSHIPTLKKKITTDIYFDFLCPSFARRCTFLITHARKWVDQDKPKAAHLPTWLVEVGNRSKVTPPPLLVVMYMNSSSMSASVSILLRKWPFQGTSRLMSMQPTTRKFLLCFRQYLAAELEICRFLHFYLCCSTKGT